MNESVNQNDFERKTIRIHKKINDKIEEYKKEELLPTWNEAVVNLIKKGLENIKEEKKRW
jgi:hypothetical protein